MWKQSIFKAGQVRKKGCVNLSKFSIMIGLIVLAGIIYLFRVASSAKQQKTRIFDLITVGLLLLLSVYLQRYVPGFSRRDSLEIAGILVFAYGWVILIVEKFREGLKGNQ